MARVVGDYQLKTVTMVLIRIFLERTSILIDWKNPYLELKGWNR